MKKKNGFIAISLIYSFFLVFLALLFSIAMDYSENRILLNDVKKETQEYLDTLGEFNPIFIENRNYTVGEEVSYAYETWQVLEDNRERGEVKLILNRIFTRAEIERAFLQIKEQTPNKEIPMIALNSLTGMIQMCLNFNASLTSANTSYCGYGSLTNYRYYNYGNSVVRHVLNSWYNDNSTLKKAERVGYLNLLSFGDGLKDYSGANNLYELFIRLPLVSEAGVIQSLTGEKNIWYVEGEHLNSLSYIKTANGRDLATNQKGIRPVIVVKKNLS